MSRVDQYAVTISCDGRNLGTWDGLDGGGVDSDEQKYRRGGLGAQVSLGGQQTVENLTANKLLEDPDEIRWLMGRAGKGQCVCNRQKLDANGNPWGRPMVYRGTLKTVTPSSVDANSNDPDVYTIVVSTEGSVG